MKLTFGKYKGEKLTEVPYGYLKYLERETKDSNLRINVITEIANRRNCFLDQLMLKEEDENEDLFGLVGEF